MAYCWVLPGKGGKPRSRRVVRLARRCFEKTGEFAKIFEIVEIVEIVRKKAKFSETSAEIYRNFPKRGVKFAEISRNFSDGTDVSEGDFVTGE